MARGNPGPLVIFGNPPEGPLSEKKAWAGVVQEAKAIKSLLSIGKTQRAVAVADRLLEIAQAMQAQLASGVHANPRNISRPTILSHHVQAIAYVHEKDGGQYVHGFADVELNEKDLKRGWLNLSELPTKTNIDMIGYPDGTVTLIGTKGQPLAALFPE